jgi:prephenate dehydrogenase
LNAFPYAQEVPRWENIALIGVGLLGGSLGLAIRQRGIAQQVSGYARSPQSKENCLKTGVVDRVETDLARTVSQADLIVLSTPIAQMAVLAEAMLPALKKGCLVTDVGSVKASVVHTLEPLLTRGNAHFIGSHPMAGAEKMGVLAAKSDLFDNAICAITPTAQSDPVRVAELQEFWEAVGTRPLLLTPELHDDLVGRSSHLPHVVAAELANCVLSPAHPKEQGILCANGFRDTTRVASGSPEMWRDISLANRENLARVLGVFIEDLQGFRRALEQKDVTAVEEFFAQAKQRRDDWSAQAPASPSPE